MTKSSTPTVEDSRERLAQPYGIVNPENADAPAGRDALGLIRGTVPDALDPTAPDVTTANRAALAGQPPAAKPVPRSQRALADAKVEADRNSPPGTG